MIIVRGTIAALFVILMATAWLLPEPVLRWALTAAAVIVCLAWLGVLRGIR